MDRSARGFTLVELMVVVVIIGILATIGVVSYMRHLEKARQDLTQAILKEVGGQVQMYQVQNSRYPQRLEVLVEEKFMEEVPQDGWKRNLVYETSRDGSVDFSLISLGADGVRSTSDDLDWRRRKQ